MGTSSKLVLSQKSINSAIVIGLGEGVWPRLCKPESFLESFLTRVWVKRCHLICSWEYMAVSLELLSILRRCLSENLKQYAKEEEMKVRNTEDTGVHISGCNCSKVVWHWLFSWVPVAWNQKSQIQCYRGDNAWARPWQESSTWPVLIAGRMF